MVAIVTKKSCYINLKFLETLKDTPSTSEGFRFVPFVILEILVWVHFDPPPPPWCLVWVPKPLVPKGLIWSCKQSIDAVWFLNGYLVYNPFTDFGLYNLCACQFEAIFKCTSDTSNIVFQTHLVYIHLPCVGLWLNTFKLQLQYISDTSKCISNAFCYIQLTGLGL